MEHICLIAIDSDAKLKFLEKRAMELRSPEITVCYVRISDRIPTSRKLLILKKLREIFADVEMDVESVSDYHVRLLDIMHNWCMMYYGGKEKG